MQIGNYKVTHKLGGGGMGMVFRVEDQRGQPFAIKMIGSHVAIHATIHVEKALQNAAALDLSARMRLVREARLATELTHPNIVKTFDYGQHGGLLYIVMEFLPGRSLDKVIPIHGAVPLRIKIKMIRQICDALEYAHRHGVMHRDIKPANTIVLPNANVKVLDFGLAARLREPLPGDTAWGGTWPYMAPEVAAKSQVYDSRVDIWSAGVTFYQLLTGRLPFYAPSISQVLYDIIHAPLPRLDKEFPHATELERVLDRALAKNPLERYATAGDFARDLRRLEDEVAEHRTLLVGNSRAIDDEPWWASTLSHVPPSPGTELNEANETVSMVSGDIRARGAGHALRYVEYNTETMPFVVLGILCAGSYALFAKAVVGSPDGLLSTIAASPNVGFWVLISYIFGWGIPVVLAISVGLGALVYWEKFAEIPRCAKCKAWMEHTSRVSRFAYSEKSWAHASSDCVAALRENLWEDAAKLLSMHGELVTPGADERTSWPVIRYHLDFYSCERCGDEHALLTTEDRIGETWNAREDYVGACRSRLGKVVKTSPFNTLAGIFGATRRAAQLSKELIQPIARLVFLVLALFIGAYYYPQIPLLLGLPGYKASITITSNPIGQSLLVDGQSISTPKTFLWTYNSIHSIAGLTPRRINGHIYQFALVTPDVNVGEKNFDGRGGYGTRIERTVTITAAKDKWGLPGNLPLIPSYTVVFSNAEPPDFQSLRNLWEAQARQNSQAVQNKRNFPKILDGPFAQARQTVVVTSVPPGLSIVVDKDWILTPKTYHWPMNSTHTLAAPALQVFSQSKAVIKSPEPIYYADGRWNNAPSEHTITVTVPGKAPLGDVTYTAKFQRVTLPPVGQTGLQPEEKK